MQRSDSTGQVPGYVSSPFPSSRSRPSEELETIQQSSKQQRCPLSKVKTVQPSALKMALAEYEMSSKRDKSAPSPTTSKSKQSMYSSQDADVASDVSFATNGDSRSSSRRPSVDSSFCSSFSSISSSPAIPFKMPRRSIRPSYSDYIINELPADDIKVPVMKQKKHGNSWSAGDAFPEALYWAFRLGVDNSNSSNQQQDNRTKSLSDREIVHRIDELIEHGVNKLSTSIVARPRTDRKPQNPQRWKSSDQNFSYRSKPEKQENDAPGAPAPRPNEEQYFSELQEKFPVFRSKLVLEAFLFAQEAHRGQFRLTGEPYVMHALETAVILANFGFEDTVVVSGLLHDVLDDTKVTWTHLHKRFGNEIADLVAGVSKVSQINALARKRPATLSQEEVERLNRMILSMVSDVRVVLVKMADRLHNMRTVHALPKEKQMRMARDTLDIYAPLASRLGIWRLKAELEDLCFSVLQPEACRRLKETMQQETEATTKLQETIEKLKFELDREGISCQITGRAKNLYSIYKKMMRKKRNLDKIFDVRAIRVIVTSKEECYKVLEKVHALWTPIQSEFNDYVCHPKENNYQSIHTAVYADSSHAAPFEVQIRTKTMHEAAEFGLAAHWRYKEQRSDPSEQFLDDKIRWLRLMLEWRQKVMSPEVFHVVGAPFPLSFQCLQNSIIVVTSTGEILELPVGSSASDAAQSKGCDLSNFTWRFEVNGQLVDRHHRLKDGDMLCVFRCPLEKALTGAGFARTPDAFALKSPVAV